MLLQAQDNRPTLGHLHPELELSLFYLKLLVVHSPE